MTPEQSVELAARAVGLTEQVALLLLELPPPLRERALKEFVSGVRSLLPILGLAAIKGADGALKQ